MRPFALGERAPPALSNFPTDILSLNAELWQRQTVIDALVSDSAGNLGPDSLFLVGDGAQKIYPGGFTLAQAGLDVRSNSTVLRVNYRNTQEILTEAMACAGSEQVDDLGDKFLRGDAEADAQRGEGLKPQLVRAGDCDAQIGYIAARVREFLRTETLNMKPSDIGVFAANNKLVNQAIVGLPREGVQAESMENNSGRRNECLQVGTFHHAKGLEFKVVFLLDIFTSEFPKPRDPFRETDEAVYEDHRALAMSQLFVAMTRTRDGLFILCNQKPSDVLAIDSFKVVRGWIAKSYLTSTSSMIQ